MRLSTTTEDVCLVGCERLFALLTQISSPSILYRYSLFLPSLSSTASEKQDIFKCHSAEVPDKYLQRFLSWLRSLRLSQQTFESIRFQLLKGLHNHIGVKILAFVAYPYAPHTGAARSFDAGSSVFHDNAPPGRNANSRSS